MVRFYFMPTINGAPKYIQDMNNPDGVPVLQFTQIPYGLVNATLIVADVTEEQHQELNANVDVVAAPEDIDAQVSAIAIPTIENLFDALKIPSGWVNTSHTYRQVLRRVAGLFLFADRYAGIFEKPLVNSSSDLELMWNQVPSAIRQEWAFCADTFNYDYSAITNQWTVKRSLWHLSDQWGAQPIYMGFTEL